LPNRNLGFAQNDKSHPRQWVDFHMLSTKGKVKDEESHQRQLVVCSDPFSLTKSQAISGRAWSNRG